MKKYNFIDEISKEELDKLFEELSETMKKEILEINQKEEEVLETSEDFDDFKIYHLDVKEKIY